MPQAQVPVVAGNVVTAEATRDLVRAAVSNVFDGYFANAGFEQGFDAALDRKQRDTPARPRKLDGRGEARLIALACSPPPDDRAVWTMQLLADKLVELEVVESISDETVRTLLKKMRSSRG